MIDHYRKILLKRWQLIVICFVVTGLAVFTGSKMVTPIYQSTAIVQVTVNSNNSQADISGLLASDQLVETEAQLAISNPVLSEVASHYAGLSLDALAMNVHTTVKANTQLFEIDVFDASPTRAAALANDIARTLIKQQIRATQQNNIQSQQQVQQDIAQTRQQIESVSSQIANLQKNGGNDGQISALQALLSGLQQHYTQWQSLLAQLELTQAQNGNFLHIAQEAQIPVKPASPNVSLNTAIGFSMGLLLGVVLAMLLEQLDTRILTVEDLKALVEWPVLATVWRPEPSKSAVEDLINPPSHSANIEAYRILRTNLGFSLIGKPQQTLLVTSAVPGEGKTTTAANLAIFLAKAGKKTLLIDADLRRPAIGEKLQIPADKGGLSNAIVACAQSPLTTPKIFMLPTKTFPGNEFSLGDYTQTIGIPNLLVVPSGPLPPNPPELLDSSAMETFQENLASSGAQVVVFDSPPLLGLSDASILASKVDGILIVIDIERANRKNIEQMKAILAQSGGRVLGCVVNKQRRKRKDTSYYTYYYYHEAEERKDARPSHNPKKEVSTAMAKQPVAVHGNRA
jgi:Mrp family chromosome partitioning ATPase/capsular polysaccharide biosynthesis protein